MGNIKLAKDRKNDRIKGLIVGLITPLVVVPLVLFIISITQNYIYSQLWHQFKLNMPYQIKIITLSIIANLGWFYFFINKERFNFARGIIFATMLFAPYIIYIKFF